MPRKRSSTSTSLPTPAPENTATREYYRSSETNDAHDRDTDYPTSRRPSPEEQRDKNGQDVSSQEVYDFVEVCTNRDCGLSPSNIVLSCDLEDMAEMSNLEQAIRDLPREQRKELLVALQEKLRADRKKAVEEAEEQKTKGLDEEYDEVQRKGREEV